MTTTRTFLTDPQLDELLDSLPGPSGIPVAILDQFGAASREAAAMGQGIALRAVANGGWALLGTNSTDPDLTRRMIRPRMKMMLAAFSAGITHLCDHTRQIRPMLLLCDPPAMVCMQAHCIARAEQLGKTMPFHWDNHCDACGQHGETLAPHLAALGALTVSAHVCRACADDLAVTAVEAADDIQTVTRKDPCPCGSGSRYKRCHGSTRR